MWILSCAGELFGGKRFWLRPGSTHLLGRTSGRPENGERIRFIDHKSVSRKHLLLEVGPVLAGDSARVHTRTEITLTDTSKVGTTVDGDKIIRQSKTLSGRSKKVHEIRLGNYEALFALEWQDVVLTCTSLKKSTEAGTLESKRQLLEGVDAKIVSDYVTNETTHVLGKKRNTAVALQALVQARWVVTYDFMDALARAARRVGTDEDGDPRASLLEEDFDEHWPKEEGYIIEPGENEIQRRPNEYLLPKPERAEVFQDYTFIFLSHTQYDTLLPVITSGGGKALLFKVTSGETRVEELVDYVKTVAGKKGANRFMLSQHTGRGGIVVVRLNEHGRNAFAEQVDLELGQRGFEQNQFLDVILTMDTNELRKELSGISQSLARDGEEEIRASAPTPGQSQSREEQPIHNAPREELGADDQPQKSGQPESEAAKRVDERSASTVAKRWKRAPGRSRFKGFGELDPSQFQRSASESPEPLASSVPEASQAQSMQNMDVDGPSQVSADTQQNARKRPAPDQENSEEGGDIYESILPGQAALKRRKMEAVKSGASTFFKTAVGAEKAAAETAAKAKKRAEKQIDVKSELKARREAEEEQRRKDEEALKELQGIDVKELRNLAKVEGFELPVREHATRATGENGRSDRWNPAWNGRKNFKKFRPQGQRRDGPRLQRVIVTLEEVGREGHGVGEEYWLQSSAAASSRGEPSRSQSQSQTAHAAPSDDHHNDTGNFRRRIQRSREEDAEHAADNALDPVEVAGQPRDEAYDTAVPDSVMSQSLTTESQRKKAAGKRPAASQGGGPTKKTRQTTLRNTPAASWDDDDDDLKFRRRRR